MAHVCPGIQGAYITACDTIIRRYFLLRHTVLCATWKVVSSERSSDCMGRRVVGHLLQLGVLLLRKTTLKKARYSPE